MIWNLQEIKYDQVQYNHYPFAGMMIQPPQVQFYPQNAIMPSYIPYIIIKKKSYE